MGPAMRISAATTAVVATGVLLKRAGPGPLDALRSLGHVARYPASTLAASGTEAAVLPIALAVCWAALGWLAVVLAMSAASALPGTVGRLAHAAARTVTPAFLRRVLIGSIGLTLATAAGSTSAFAASAHEPGRPAGIAGLRLDWPTSVATSPPARRPATSPAAAPPATPPTAAPPATPPTAAPPATPPAAAPPADTTVSTVVVRPGDSLWTIAERHLGPHATDRAVAIEWPRWWNANRSVVGDTPDLIHPGQHLRVPGSPEITGGTS